MENDKIEVSEVGFEPTPSYEDQNTQIIALRRSWKLESGALDPSAILTWRRQSFYKIKTQIVSYEYKSSFSYKLDFSLSSKHDFKIFFVIFSLLLQLCFIFSPSIYAVAVTPENTNYNGSENVNSVADERFKFISSMKWTLENIADL